VKNYLAQMLADLEEEERINRYYAVSNLIEDVNTIYLTQLSSLRRSIVLDVYEANERSLDATADALGITNTKTMRRLVDEAQSQRRREQATQEAA
jgi:hypothetical protein